MRRFFSIFPIFLIGSVTASAADGLYTTETIPYQHHALDINDAGKIVGEFRGTIQHGIHFNGSDWLPKGNGDDFSWSALYAINNRGAAVGLNTIPPQGAGPLVVHAVRMEPSGDLINLGSLTGENGNARARGINDLNIAVGDSLNVAGKRVAVRFETNGTVSDLSLGADSSSALDINNRGDIAGEITSATGLTRGFYIPWDGIMQDLGTLGGNETFVARMNSRGEIVGRSRTSSGAMRAFIYLDGAMTDLGTLGGNESAAYGINDAGVIVGGAAKTNGSWTPFIKYPGLPMIDLAELVNVPPPEILISATAINNAGQIIVRGFINEANYIFTPEPLSVEFSSNRLKLRLAAPADLRVRIDSAESLPNWRPFSTNTMTSQPLILEADAAGATMFFRAVIGVAD
jgi:probable HAF family extracellular repeat protein